QGAYATTGSSNAYVLTPSVALATYITGERYSARASFSNTDSATLNISSHGAKTIKKMGAAGKVNLDANGIRQGQPFTVVYDGTDRVLVTPPANSVLPAPGTSGNILVSDGSKWTSSSSVGLVPTGSVVPYVGATAPSGWLLCDGAEVSRETYAA